MKVLMVLTSHDKLGESGHATGFWLEEFTTPYYTFLDAGADITLASPKGGLPPIDPNSTQEDAQTETTERYDNDPDLKGKLAKTLSLSSVSADDFDAIFYPGGHGPLWDLSEDKASVSLIEAFASQSKPVGAVCHGPAVFRHTKGTDGEPLVSGKQVTGFSNEEEELVGLTQIVPFLVEDMFKENGATYSRGETWQSHVVTDGLIVTGQNPASSDASAKAVLALLK